MFASLLTVLAFIIAEQVIPDTPSLTMQIIIPTGSICGTMFAGWYYMFKYFMKQNQKQFEFALRQNQEQFETALDQKDKQNKDIADLHQKTIDRLFEVIKNDVEYKEILTGVLIEIKNEIKK